MLAGRCVRQLGGGVVPAGTDKQSSYRQPLAGLGQLCEQCLATPQDVHKLGSRVAGEGREGVMRWMQLDKAENLHGRTDAADGPM